MHLRTFGSRVAGRMTELHFQSTLFYVRKSQKRLGPQRANIRKVCT
jgi:hypothetical protein